MFKHHLSIIYFFDRLNRTDKTKLITSMILDRCMMTPRYMMRATLGYVVLLSVVCFTPVFTSVYYLEPT